MLRYLLVIIACFGMLGCTQETQNRIGRSLQNWTGTNGILEIYAGDKLVRRFMNVDKLSTAKGTDDSSSRPYRFGYGYLDVNLDGKIEGKEKKQIYFEISDYSTHYVFFQDPGIPMTTQTATSR